MALHYDSARKSHWGAAEDFDSEGTVRLSDKEFLGFELDCDTVERNLCPADIEIRRTDMIFSHQETLRDRLFFHPHLV